MSRKKNLADIDPFGGSGNQEQEQPSDDRPQLSMNDADAALFGELSRRERQRQIVRPISIFNIYPDVQQPRRAVPAAVRSHWTGEPRDIADLFNVWLKVIDDERAGINMPGFNLDDLLWSESIEVKGHEEDTALDGFEPGPIERSFVRVVELAISIRRDGLANPATIHRKENGMFRLETGERRWLAFHILYGYFNGTDSKPNEREKWEQIPAIVVDDFSVWRQASENAARADLNAIGRARQYSLLLMDLLKRQGETFEPFSNLVKPGQSDRAYYAQVADHRVPRGKSEMLSNGLGVSHRSAFSRCRSLLKLPDEIWVIGDTVDLSEDELLRISKIEPEEDAIAEARRSARNVATRNISPKGEKRKKVDKSPALPTDDALKQGKRLFSKQSAVLAKRIFDIRDGVGQADTNTKRLLRQQINELRRCLNQLEEAMDDE
jgi:hypothetical protein